MALPRRRPCIRVLGAWAIVLCLVTMTPVSAHAQEAPEYGARPSPIGGTPRAELAFVHAIESGSSVADAVDVINHANTNATFDVYAVDLVPSASGGRAPAPRSAATTGPGAWVTVDEGPVAVEAFGTREVPFVIEVPIGTAPGSYTASLIVERTEAAGTGTIIARTRIALPIEVAVLGSINTGVAIGPISTTPTDDGIELAFPITNSGDVTFSASGAVAIDGWPASHDAALAATPRDLTLGPGESTTLRSVWSDPPLIGRYSATATVTATVDRYPPRIFAGPSSTVWIIPWGLIFTSALLIGFLIWLAVKLKPHWQAWRIRRVEERRIVDDYRRQHPVGGS